MKSARAQLAEAVLVWCTMTAIVLGLAVVVAGELVWAILTAPSRAFHRR